MALNRVEPISQSGRPVLSYGFFSSLVVAAIIVSALYFGSELFVPLAISVLLAFSLSPVVRVLRRWRIPKGFSVSITVLMAFVTMFAIGAIITSQVRQLGNDLPRFEAALKAKVRDINAMAGSEGGALDRASETLRDLEAEFGKSSPPGPNGQDKPAPAGQDPGGVDPIPVEVHPPPPTALEQIETIISVALSPLATVGVIVVFVVFLLLKQSDVRDRAIRLLGAHDLEKTTAALDDAGQRLSSYFLALLLMNAGFGAAIGVGLWAIGIPNAILWGIMAMLMRFMPMIGVFIAAAIPFVLAAAVDPGWTMVFAVVALYLAAEGLMNFVVEPLMQSSSTGLSSLAILLAAAFWTLLWGPIGLVLAVPLTALLVVLGRHVDGLAFLDVLLGDTPPLTPSESFYQRMLADDPHEAAEQAEVYLRDKSLIEYYDEVLMEGLRRAQADADSGKLGVARLADIRDVAISMIEDLDEPEPEPESGEEGAPLAFPEDWRAEGAIICVAGQSALDELGALILMKLLQARGFRPRLMHMSDVSSAQIEGNAMSDVKIVCVSMFDIEHRGAYLKFLVRRLRRILPGTTLLGGFWKHDPHDLRQRAILEAVDVDLHVASLAEVIAHCVSAAQQDVTAIQPPQTSPLLPAED